MEYQHKDLPDEPHDAASDLIDMVGTTVATASRRFNGTVELQRGKAVTLETAFESLREIEEAATWAIRMLIEINGSHRREYGASRRTLSMRRTAELSGVSLASVHAWVNHPAEVIDGTRGPGTLPKPGQTSHYYSGGQVVQEDDPEVKVDLDELLGG